MGEALDGLHRDSQAIQEFQDAAAVAPGAPDVHFGLGYLYWKQRKFDEAEAEFRRELKNDPENAQAMAYLADVEIRRHNDGEAQPLLERALRGRKDLRIAYLDLGILDADNKKYAKAVRSLKQAIHLDPARADAYYRLSIVYQAMGHSADAAATRAEILRLEKKRVKTCSVRSQDPLPRPALHQIL